MEKFLPNTYLLNIDPGTRKKSIVTTVERFFESALESTIGKENAEKIALPVSSYLRLLIAKGLRNEI